MTAYLTYPSSGSVHVEPTTEIVVSFEDIDAVKENTNIKIDGEWAVKDGQIQPGFINTRYSLYNSIMQWGLRKRGGLKPRDIVVSAWCSPDCATVEQRFYVRGAKCTVLVTTPTDKQWCRTLGGVFVTDDDMAFPDRVSASFDGRITRDEESWYVPSEIIKQNMDIVRMGSSWILTSTDNKRTYVARPNRLNVYDFSAKSVKIVGGFINLQIDETTSAHLPMNYSPASTETGLSDWFLCEHEGDWKMVFHRHIHVWWSNDKFIAKHSPNPIIGYSDDMLWTNKELKTDIDELEVIDGNHVLVNRSLYVNTYHPEITRIK